MKEGSKSPLQLHGERQFFVQTAIQLGAHDKKASNTSHIAWERRVNKCTVHTYEGDAGSWSSDEEFKQKTGIDYPNFLRDLHNALPEEVRILFDINSLLLKKPKAGKRSGTYSEQARMRRESRRRLIEEDIPDEEVSRLLRLVPANTLVSDKMNFASMTSILWERFKVSPQKTRLFASSLLSSDFPLKIEERKDSDDGPIMHYYIIRVRDAHRALDIWEADLSLARFKRKDLKPFS